MVSFSRSATISPAHRYTRGIRSSTLLAGHGSPECFGLSNHISRTVTSRLEHATNKIAGVPVVSRLKCYRGHVNTSSVGQLNHPEGSRREVLGLGLRLVSSSAAFEGLATANRPRRTCSAEGPKMYCVGSLYDCEIELRMERMRRVR